MPRVNYLLYVGTAVLGTGIMASAQTAPPAAPAALPRQVAAAVTGRASQGAQSTIRGTVVDSGGSPLANASVRLRNLKTHQVEQVSVASPGGEFTFTVLPRIPYAVEIADNAGQIIAVGDVVTVQVGEVAAVLVAAPVRLSSMAGVFGETASSVLSAVAGTGLTAASSALAPEPPPASPER